MDPDVDHTADGYQAGAGTGETHDPAATDQELPHQHGGGTV